MFGDGFVDARHFVAGLIVGDDNVAWAEHGRQELLDIGAEGGAIDRGRPAPRVLRSGRAVSLPGKFLFSSVPRCVADQPLSSWRMAAQPCHVSLSPGLVQKNQAPRVKLWFCPVPKLAGLCDVSAQSLGSDQYLF